MAVATLVVAGMASAFMAWTIGAGSSGSTPFAPAVGANAISVLRAGFVVGVLGFAGAVLQGANVTEAVGTALIRGVSISAVGTTAGLLVAATLVAVGVFAGYPIATAFTVTGAVVGVGLALGGDPAWAKYRQIAALWVLVPFVGGGSAYGTARLLRNERVPETVAVPALAGIVGIVVANVGFGVLGGAGGSASIAGVTGRVVDTAIADGATVPQVVLGGVTTGPGRLLVTGVIAAGTVLVLRRDMRPEPADGQRHFLLALGALVAFSAGGSQVGLALGPLVPLLDDVSVSLTVVLVGGGLGLLAGSWTGAPRMIKAISQDYSSLGPRRSIAALIPAFLIAQTAVAFGIPISFNEIIVSAVVGSGYASGGAGVSRRKLGYTVLAWAGSLVLALGGGYAIVAAVRTFGPLPAVATAIVATVVSVGWVHLRR